MKIYKLLIVSIILSSCGEEEMDQRSVLDCLGEPEELSAFASCDIYEPNDIVCDYLPIGEFSLSDGSKEFMVYACNDIGDEFEYQNSAGEKQVLEVTDFDFRVSTAGFVSASPCEEDSTRLKGMCIVRDVVSVALTSQDPDLEIEIEILINADSAADNFGGVGEFLSIRRKKNANTTYQDLEVVIDKQTLSYDSAFGQEFYTTITILDEVFQNVFSDDVSNFANPKYKYYYTKAEGLIGFEDLEGTVWKRT